MDINRLFEKNKGKEEEKYELIKRKSPSISARASNVAVSERFELSIRCRIHTFQACSFSHSDNSPNQIVVSIANEGLI